jgi:hypothetical protein
LEGWNASENLRTDTLARFGRADFCASFWFILFSEIVSKTIGTSEFCHAGISFLSKAIVSIAFA